MRQSDTGIEIFISVLFFLAGCLWGHGCGESSGTKVAVRECRDRARDAYEACQTAKTQGCADRYVADLALCDPE